MVVMMATQRPLGLHPYAVQALDHWQKYLPKMYAELERKGELIQAARDAAEQTLNDLDQIEEELLAGARHEPAEAGRIAWELVRERYILLPAEDDDSDYDS
jgi:hypothetical protein